MSVGLALFTAISVAEAVQPAAAVMRYAEAGLDLLGYAALTTAGLAVLIAGGRWRNRDAWLDVVTLLLAAGLTTLRHCTDEVYAHCDEVAAALAHRIGTPVVGFSVNGDAGATFSPAQVASAVGAARPGDITITPSWDRMR